MKSIRYFISIYLLIALVGCKDEVVSIDFDFSNDECFAPCNVAFSNKSVGKIESYKWEFGDNGTETIQNPTHSFSQVGIYNVTLIAFDKREKEIGRKSKPVNILKAPQLDFSIVNNNCNMPCAITFTNNSSNLESVSTLKWDFGDATPEISSTPTTSAINHLYDVPGNMTVTLKAYSSSGKEIAALSKPVTLNYPIFTYAKIYSLTINSLTVDTTYNWNESPNLPDIMIDFLSSQFAMHYYSPVICQDCWNNKINLPITITGDATGQPYGNFTVNDPNIYIIGNLADDDNPSPTPFSNLYFPAFAALYLQQHTPTYQNVNGENLWIFDIPISATGGKATLSGTARFVYYYQ